MRKTAALTSCRCLNKFLIVLMCGLTACVVAPPAPYEPYVLARAAVRAAQEADSVRFAPGLWHRAEENYRNGAKAFKEADYKDSEQYFLKAIEYAERAENSTRLKKFQSGDSFP